MFHLRITQDDNLPGKTWSWHGNRWHCGASWIEPYRHPLTEQVALTDGTRIVLASAARRSSARPSRPEVAVVSPGDYDIALGEVRDLHDDWTTLEFQPGQRVRLAIGTACTVPQYLAVEDGVLHGSWDLANLRGQQRPDRLDALAITRHLALRARYSPATFWRDVKLLTERATADFCPDGSLTFQLPEPAEHSRARALRTGADPIRLFTDLLELAIHRIPWTGSRTAVQLSGGMDSTTVALAMRTAANGAGVTAGTVILDAERGAQQTERRRLILEHIASGWSSLTVQACEHLPYGPSSRFSEPVWVSPTTDIYADALNALSSRFAAAGVRTVFTGIGGDELMATTAAEDTGGWGGFEPADTPPWLGPAAHALLPHIDTAITPAAVVPETTLMAKTVCGPAFLRHGLWPVHPLTDPALVRFCEWLPLEWRRDKQVMRVILARTGMASKVARPPVIENFQQIITEAMRRHGVPRMRQILADGSPLIEARLLDPDGLALVAARLEGGTPAAGDHEAVFALLADSALTCR
ncbi:asparagine synthase-related protein [Kitasatospora sp. NPDC059571]|uniref:asparagine synthase-related protein n=1 Tax=Kitasatospora sp. NPDC059571 TaxID=3346871 RepID=UPI0036787E01